MLCTGMVWMLLEDWRVRMLALPWNPLPLPLPFLLQLHTALWLGGHLFPTASQTTVAERETMVPYKG